MLPIKYVVSFMLTVVVWSPPFPLPSFFVLFFMVLEGRILMTATDGPDVSAVSFIFEVEPPRSMSKIQAEPVKAVIVDDQ